MFILSRSRQTGRYTVPIARVLPALFFTVLLAGCTAEQPLPPLADDAVILAFGDSLTYGTGAGPEASYPARLQEKIGRTVINAGVSGELSAAGLQRLPGLLTEHRPDLVILCHGGNDILRKKDGLQTRANIDQMIRLARDTGATVILLGVPRPGIFLKSAEFYTGIARDTGTYYLPDLIPEVLSDKSLKSDTVHPNAAGYAHIADALAMALEEDGAL